MNFAALPSPFGRLIAAAQRKWRAGFSMVEVLVGFGILTAGILAIMAIFPQMIQAENEAELLTQAAALAQMKAEEIRRDDDRNGTLVTEIRNLATPTDPITFPHEPRLSYSFSGHSLMYGTEATSSSDTRASDGIARVLVRYSATFRPTQEVIYELRFN